MNIIARSAFVSQLSTTSVCFSFEFEIDFDLFLFIS